MGSGWDRMELGMGGVFGVSFWGDGAALKKGGENRSQDLLKYNQESKRRKGSSLLFSYTNIYTYLNGSRTL